MMDMHSTATDNGACSCGSSRQTSSSVKYGIPIFCMHIRASKVGKWKPVVELIPSPGRVVEVFTMRFKFPALSHMNYFIIWRGTFR